jgi:fermentation-respiration switch protein FrsA (DUF1100 family)
VLAAVRHLRTTGATSVAVVGASMGGTAAADAAIQAPGEIDRIRAQFERAPEPKRLVILEGTAHAQFIFATDQGERLLDEILRFLSEP